MPESKTSNTSCSSSSSSSSSNNNSNNCENNNGNSSDTSSASSSSTNSTSSSASSITLTKSNQVNGTSIHLNNSITSSSSSSLANNNNNNNINNLLATPLSANNSAGASQVTEKPSHYTYLKGFRVEQCSLFLQHKCTQHRPYTCFYWHFKNQRRRRPIRKRDGTFNYNPDVYCEKYDEQSGVCPNADECPFVHRNAGDTEKRYHLRYYKTATCIHETDAKGNCTKNGTHCAFAHGASDMRPPVYDLKEMQLQQQQQATSTTITTNTISNPNNILNLSIPSGSGGIGGSSSSVSSNGNINGNSTNLNTPTSGGSMGNLNDLMLNEKTLNLSTSLEKERILNEDPKWNETNYVLINYKTEQCKRPPRLCRQGFACPQYHNARDKRRNPSIFKYRSTPCPNVKQGDDWLEPTVCENGDLCKYCHSRTEQQFHPEIYKSSKCNDMITTGYCPRGPFCAFAHIEQELKNQRAHSTSESSNSDYTLENFISNVLPSKENESSESLQNNGELINNFSNSNENVILNESFQQQLNLQNHQQQAQLLLFQQQNQNKFPNVNLSNYNELSSSTSTTATHTNQNENNNDLLQQQQQQNLALNQSYNKPIGSERPKTTPFPPLLALQQNKTNSNIRSSSPYHLTNEEEQHLALNKMKQQQTIGLSPGVKQAPNNQLTGLNSNQSASSSSSSSPSPSSNTVHSNTTSSTTTNTTSSSSSTSLNMNSNNNNRNLVIQQQLQTNTTISPPILVNNHNGTSVDTVQLALVNSVQNINNNSNNILMEPNSMNSQQQKFISNSNTPMSYNLSQQQQQQLQQQQFQRQTPSNINFNKSDNFTNTVLNLNSSANNLIDLEKEKLKQELLKQTEMSNKLETLCLQYRQWVEKLTVDVNEWKNKFIQSETERKKIELQLFNNKMNTDQGLLSSTRNTNFNSNPNSNLPNNTSLNSSSNLNNLYNNINNIHNNVSKK